MGRYEQITCGFWCVGRCGCRLLGVTRLQVFDEADTLLAGGFVDDIAFVYGALQVRKQVRIRAFARRPTPTRDADTS